MPVKKKAVKKAIKKSTPKPAAAKTIKKEPFKNYVTHLQPGNKAPVFKGLDQDGKAISLADFKEKNWYSIFILKMTRQPVPNRHATCGITICSSGKKELKLLVLAKTVLKSIKNSKPNINFPSV
jgi:hypothetical protein